MIWIVVLGCFAVFIPVCVWLMRRRMKVCDYAMVGALTSGPFPSEASEIIRLLEPELGPIRVLPAQDLLARVADKRSASSITFTFEIDLFSYGASRQGQTPRWVSSLEMSRFRFSTRNAE